MRHSESLVATVMVVILFVAIIALILVPYEERVEVVEEESCERAHLFVPAAPDGKREVCYDAAQDTVTFTVQNLGATVEGIRMTTEGRTQLSTTITTLIEPGYKATIYAPDIIYENLERMTIAPVISGRICEKTITVNREEFTPCLT